MDTETASEHLRWVMRPNMAGQSSKKLTRALLACNPPEKVENELIMGASGLEGLRGACAWEKCALNTAPTPSQRERERERGFKREMKRG